MRPVVLGCAFLGFAGLAGLALGGACGCSRNPPSSSDIALHPSTTEPTGATLLLATALGEGPDAGAEANQAETPPSLAGKVVLHVGDSMVGGNFGLTKALDHKFTAEGAKFIRDYKVSESIVSYDHSPKLKELIARHKPDIVIITLGTNDVFVPYPAAMANNVQNIVKRVGARECYWMGPPTWKPDTGIVQVIKDNAAPCKFYDSSNLKLQRAGDGIHPTDRGGADWASSFWTFFQKTTSAAADAGAR